MQHARDGSRIKLAVLFAALGLPVSLSPRRAGDRSASRLRPA
jgi:hypothetical protein